MSPSFRCRFLPELLHRPLDGVDAARTVGYQTIEERLSTRQLAVEHFDLQAEPSGEPRSLPLIYGSTGDSYIIIASKGGMPTHPVWYLNLEAKPECELMVGAKAVSAHARTVTGKERERIWNLMAEIYPPYLDYQKATEREIPVIVLDPI